ncbi:MAG TPA: asparagine synthase-related protein [Sphingomicrobium sp.]|nr:asparagine synthase-related protein [Sphingomicrobium sp.]
MHVRYAVSFERGISRHSLRERAARCGLEIKLERPSVLILADPQTPLVTGGDRVLIGQIFDGPSERVADLDSVFTNQDPIPRAGFWGNFLALGANESAPFVYRDPSGSIPAYEIVTHDGAVFVSDAELACSLGLLERPEVDLSFAVHWLQFPFLRSERTGLRGVRELLPGSIRRLRGGSWLSEPGWKPWDHVRLPRGRSSFDQFARELRRITLISVAAQVRGSSPLLQLSGGLDSSIIAASLAHAGIGFISVNFASRSLDGDERRYAREVAERFGSRHLEILEDDLDRSIRASAKWKFRPGSNPVLLPLDEAIEERRREAGAEVLVDGGGGDNLFCYLTGTEPILDALRSAGLAQAWRSCTDIGELAGCTRWDVAASALRRAAPWGWWRWKEDRRYLNREMLLSGPDPHPWLETPRFSLPGKREHVASLVHIQHFLNRRAERGSALLHPLMAEPLLEFCLSIPSWEWMRGGIDRAVARRAFQDLLPPKVIERRSKGSLQGLFHRFFTALRGDLRDLLLSGRLVGLGIVDADSIEQAFVRGDWKDDEVQMRLSEMASLDLWIQSWSV